MPNVMLAVPIAGATSKTNTIPKEIMKGGRYRLELDGAFVNALRVGIDAGGACPIQSRPAMSEHFGVVAS